MHEAPNNGPLADLRVVEMGQLIAGPFCGQLLGDMGAEVIKLEAPGAGDPMRGWGQGAPVWWEVIARNKQSASVNLRTAKGQDLARRLIATADVLIENFRPGTLEGWNLSPDRLMAENPGLIVARMSGYGQTGPYAERTGFGLIGEAMGGWRQIVGEPDRPPSRMGVSIGDTLAASYGCMGVLAALHDRERTGQGQVIDSALYEAVLQVMEAMIPEYTIGGHTRERSGAILPGIAPSNVYRCKDGDYLIGANQDGIFRRLCAGHGPAGTGRRSALRHPRRPGRATGRAGRPDRDLDSRTHHRRGRGLADRGRRPGRQALSRAGDAGRSPLRRPRGDREAGASEVGRGRHAERLSQALPHVGRRAFDRAPERGPG